MANYRAIIRCFPAAQDYLQQRKWVRRGDILAYAPGLRTKAFSTDEFGFRHTRFRGEDLGLGAIADHQKVGLVLGSSHLFGFGLAGNGDTLPSQLSEHLGYPVFGIAYPEADTRTLYGTLLRLLRQFPDRIGRVFLLTGGDFTRFCYSETADPLFGSPLLPFKTSGPGADAQKQLASLVHFSGFWTAACATLTAQAGAQFYFVEDCTFFEKSSADATEAACGLGTSTSDKQAKRFACHRRHLAEYVSKFFQLAMTLKLPLLRCFKADELLFIDEYHYRAESQRLIAERLLEQMA